MTTKMKYWSELGLSPIQFMYLGFFLVAFSGQHMKNLWLDNLGACIPVGQTGYVIDMDRDQLFNDRGWETNYYIEYWLRDGKTCRDNVTPYDYERVSRGSSVSRQSRSPLCEKVWGAPCGEAFVRMVFVTALAFLFCSICYRMSLLLAPILLIDWWGNRLWCILLGDEKSELVGVLPTLFTWLVAGGLWLVFLQVGLREVRHENPTSLALLVVLLGSLTAAVYAVTEGGRVGLLHNLRVVLLGAVVFWVVAVLAIVLGLGFYDTLRSLSSAL